MDWLGMPELTDPALWAGLATLIVIELVLGIDNLIFIAILVDKLPAAQRDQARLIGLSLALGMRLALLAAMSWLMGLTATLVSFAGLDLSGRDLILLGGGLFLIYKATSEIHDHLSASTSYAGGQNRGHSLFVVVIAQIVALDAVFSIDSVITAVGMVEHLPVMMAAVTIAVIVMLIASKPLTRFVAAHPTVILLCLGFLLMIGFSLVVDGMGLHIPKGYLYAAIGFSILIEFMHELRRRRQQAHARHPDARRANTAAAVMRLISGGDMDVQQRGENESAPFVDKERYMIRGVLSLADKSLSAIMTLRSDLACVDLDEPREQQIEQLRHAPRATLVAIRSGERDSPAGVIRKDRMLHALLADEPYDPALLVEQPLVLLETVSVIDTLKAFQRTGETLAFVVDEFGTLEGVVTLTDIMMDIVEDDPRQAEQNTKITRVDEHCFDIEASEDMIDVNQVLDEPLPVGRRYTSLGGLVLDRLGSIPYVGAEITVGAWRIEVRDVERYRIRLLRLCRIDTEANEAEKMAATS